MSEPKYDYRVGYLEKDGSPGALVVTAESPWGALNRAEEILSPLWPELTSVRKLPTTDPVPGDAAYTYQVEVTATGPTEEDVMDFLTSLRWVDFEGLQGRPQLLEYGPGCQVSMVYLADGWGSDDG